MFEKGVHSEINLLKWENELREKEAKIYADALRTIRKAVEIKAYDQIPFILDRLNV